MRTQETDCAAILDMSAIPPYVFHVRSIQPKVDNEHFGTFDPEVFRFNVIM